MSKKETMDNIILKQVMNDIDTMINKLQYNKKILNERFGTTEPKHELYVNMEDHEKAMYSELLADGYSTRDAQTAVRNYFGEGSQKDYLAVQLDLFKGCGG